MSELTACFAMSSRLTAQMIHLQDDLRSVMTSRLYPVDVDHFLEVLRTLQDGIVAQEEKIVGRLNSIGFQTGYSY